MLNLIMSIKNGTWNTADRESKIASQFTAAVNSLRTEHNQAVEKLRTEMNTGFADFSVRFGDSLHALREHVHGIENRIERDFMRKEDWRHQYDNLYTIMTSNKEELKSMIETVHERISTSRHDINKR